ncbi:DUF4276 family protein [Phocaeicola faecium]|uniref:DUF4276 family protein n=1 Tax=Phocaeicola faecium TaxID=2762213 RepID=A0ABR8VCB5_9BACT|nr:DUF4276 family protein [Phocaeicola faecium]MBD8002388.1 DUF4276 family protein [Phocaeicola faecium]
MKDKIIHVLCEGQTEQGFVEEVLRPYLKEQGVKSVKGILITTNKKKNAHGGMLSYNHAVTDIGLLRQTKKDDEYARHIFTTMFDLYALPNDFPGYAVAQRIGNPYARVNSLETDFAKDINDERFIPYIQLHEFESLLFCGIAHIARYYPGCDKRCKQLEKALLDAGGNPELINNGPSTAPSKRIIKAIEGDKKTHYNYNKPVTGKNVTKQIGVETLRAECRHFNEWIEKLINS